MTEGRCNPEITAARGRAYWRCGCGATGDPRGYATAAFASVAWAEHIRLRKGAA